MNKWLKFSLLGILAIIWGSSFFMMKEGLKSFSPLQVATYRIFSAGAILLPFVVHQLRKLAKEDLKYAIISGFLGNAIPALLFAFAQTKVPSGVSGSLNSMTPFFTMIFSVLVFKISVSNRQKAGVLIGLAGAWSLIYASSQGVDAPESNYLYALPIMLATLLYGLNVNLIKSKLSKYPPLVVTTIPLGGVSIFAAVLLFFTGIPSFAEIQETQMMRSTIAVLVLGIIGTAFALLLFNRLLQVSSPVFASSVTYLIPLVALLVGFWDGEPIKTGHIIGLVLILFGISLVKKRRARPDSLISR